MGKFSGISMILSSNFMAPPRFFLQIYSVPDAKAFKKICRVYGPEFLEMTDDFFRESVKIMVGENGHRYKVDASDQDISIILHSA
jgi:hypothetical protein